jgi:hypothetical protein
MATEATRGVIILDPPPRINLDHSTLSATGEN